MVVFAAGFNEAGGLARRTRLICSALAARGWDVKVVSRTGTLRRLAVQRDPGLTVLEVPGFGSQRLGAVLFLLVGLPVGLLWSRRSSVLVAFQLASPALVGGTCSRLAGKPYVAMTTTSGQFSEASFVRSRRSAPLRSWLLSGAARLVAQTEAGASELVGLVDADRVVVVPNPVQLVEPPPLTGEPHVLFTGRLSQEKDLFRLLAAWRTVLGEHPQGLLTLAGDGGHYRSVEQELRRTVQDDPELAGHVRFTGWVAEVAPLLRDADVYVLPSTTEGMSNGLLEACSWGRVVVASDIPSNRAVLGDGYPLLFRTGDTADLTRTLIRALDDEETRAAAQREVAERIRSFSLEAVMDRLEKLLSDVADRTDPTD